MISKHQFPLKPRLLGEVAPGWMVAKLLISKHQFPLKPRLLGEVAPGWMVARLLISKHQFPLQPRLLGEVAPGCMVTRVDGYRGGWSPGWMVARVHGRQAADLRALNSSLLGSGTQNTFLSTCSDQRQWLLSCLHWICIG